MDTLLISFANQKGGVGKSTLTSVYANYLSNKGDKSVVVCDCDDLQQTLVNKRERDKGNGIDASDMYDILAIKSSDFEKQYTSLFKGNVDVCFLDLPGNLMQSGVIASYFHADVLIIPTSLSLLRSQEKKDYLIGCIKKISNFDCYLKQGTFS